MDCRLCLYFYEERLSNLMRSIALRAVERGNCLHVVRPALDPTLIARLLGYDDL